MLKQLLTGLALIFIGGVMGAGSTFVVSMPYALEKAAAIEQKAAATIADRDATIAVLRTQLGEKDLVIAERERELHDARVRVTAQENKITQTRILKTICEVQRRDLWGKVASTRVYAWNVTADWAKAFYAEEKLRKAAEDMVVQVTAERDGHSVRVKELECELAKLKRVPGVCPLK